MVNKSKINSIKRGLLILDKYDKLSGYNNLNIRITNTSITVVSTTKIIMNVNDINKLESLNWKSFNISPNISWTYFIK